MFRSPDKIAGRGGEYLIIGFVLLLGVSLIPLLEVRLPPLLDYPNHLARMHILNHMDDAPCLREFYAIQWAVLPNLAMDVIVPLLSEIMPLYQAGKCFIGLTFFLMASGTMALWYVLHNRLSPWPLLAFLFLYNRHFIWGFLNFLFGLGLSFWILAAWIYCARSALRIRTVIFWILTLGLFFSHLFALGVYGLCIAGYTFWRHQEEAAVSPLKEWALALSQFILPAVLFLFFRPAAESALHQISFGGILRKITALPQPFHNYNLVLDGATFLMLSGLFVFGVFARKVIVSRQLRIALILLALFFCLMPERLLGVLSVDTRIPTAFVFLLVAGSDVNLKNLRWKKSLLFFLAGLFVVRMAVIGIHWKSADQEYRQYIAAFDRMEEGRRLFTAIVYPETWHFSSVSVSHIACLAVIEKNAFVPSLFAYPTQQPIALSEKYQMIADNAPKATCNFGKMPKWDNITKYYDYLLIINEKIFKEGQLPESDLLYCGSNFRLFRLKSRES